MKRFVLVLVAFCLLVQYSYSKRISELEALRIAEKYASVVDGGKRLSKLKRASSNKAYYVFNRSDGNGFVIISGDDRFSELVGYSVDGQFDEDNLSDNMRYWLDSYSHYVAEVGKGRAVVKKDTVSAGATSVVGPLLTTKWGQNEPYNHFTPSKGVGNCPTGCVAVAMAQIMNYHKWPLKGSGKQSYTHNYGTTSVDFSKSVYDWNNMLDEYTQQSSSAQIEAVGKLVFDAAASVRTKWGESISTASNYAIARSLRNHFGYQTEMFFRDNMTTSDFKNFIKSEFDSRRPILYIGEGKVSHAFVADGYDSNGFVHINWGWGGNGDGYFDVSFLYPDVVGIGGGTSGYNKNQAIITVVPLKNGEKPESPVKLGFYNNGDLDVGISSAPAEGTMGLVSFYVKRLWNQSDIPFSGDFALGIFDEKGTVCATSEIRSQKQSPMKAWSYNMGFYSRFSNLSLSDGEYTVVGLFRLEGETKWKKMKTKYGMRMSVKGGNYKLSSMTGVSFRVSSKPYIVGKPEVGRKVSFVFPVTNDGGLSFCPTIFLAMREKGAANTVAKGYAEPYIYDGVETEVSWDFELAPEKLVDGKTYEVYIDEAIYIGTHFKFSNDFGPITFEWSAVNSFVEEIESASVTVGPVPAEDVVYINGAVISTVRVYSAFGGIVASGNYNKMNSVSLDVSALSPGVYVLDIETMQGKVRKRFIKK